MKANKSISNKKENKEVFLRPRFSFDVSIPKEQLLKKFEKDVLHLKDSFRARIADDHIFLEVAKKEEHFWSPQLHLEFLSKEEQTTTVKGLIGPKPQVWTFFMFLHFAVGLSFLCFATILFVNWRLDKPVFLSIIMLIVLPLLWVLLYFIGKIGKDTARHQSKKLYFFMESVLKN